MYLIKQDNNFIKLHYYKHRSSAPWELIQRGIVKWSGKKQNCEYNLLIIASPKMKEPQKKTFNGTKYTNLFVGKILSQ